MIGCCQEERVEEGNVTEAALVTKLSWGTANSMDKPPTPHLKHDAESRHHQDQDAQTKNKKEAKE